MWAIRRELWDVNFPLIYDAEKRPLMVGRDEECRELIDATINMSANVIIYGQTGIGKTTLLQWLYETLEKNNIVIQMAKDRKAKTDTRFYAELTSGLVNYILYNEPPYGEVSDRTREYAKTIQHEIKKTRGLSVDYYADVFFQLLDMAEEDGLLTDDKGRFAPIYYFWDDVNYLADTKFDILHLRDVIKSFISYERRVRFAITVQIKAYGEIYKKDPALMRRFLKPHIFLTELDHEKSKELLRRRILASRIVDWLVDDDWYPFTEEAVDYIVEAAGGVPSMLIELGELVLRGAYSLRLDRIDLEFTKKRIIEANKEGAATLLERKDPTAYEIYLAIKKLGGCAKIDDIAREVGKNRTTVWRKLKGYIDDGVFFTKPEWGKYCIEE